MDQIDKGIIFQLLKNCRTSYQAMARKFNLTVNAVKKRVDKLKESGVIQDYQVYPSLAMLDAETSLAIIETEEPTTDEAFLDILGAHPLIFAASILTNGDVLCFGHYRGSKDLDELDSFLRQVEGVTEVEFHTILSEKGKKCELKTSHLKVLKCLFNDARLPIAEIAKRSRLTPRRVRKVLKEFTGAEGSEPATYLRSGSPGDAWTMQACFVFRINWDLNAGGQTAFIIRIEHMEGLLIRGKIVEWLNRVYPVEFWYAYMSTFMPIIFSIFLVEHIRDAEKILNNIQQAPGVASVKAIYGYPTKRYPGLRETYFEELLKPLNSAP